MIGVIQHMLDLDQRVGSLAGQQHRVRLVVAFERRIGHGRRMFGRRQAGQRPQFDALMRVSHDVVPRHRRQRAAGHAFGRRIIVIAHPHRADEISRVADEPAVAPIVGGAGLAGDLDAVELRAPAGAVLDHRIHHLDHVERDLRA